VAASMLHAVGLQELIAQNSVDYYDIAVSLSDNQQKLESIRKKLNEDSQNHLLFNTLKTTRNIEEAYSYMYNRSLRGLKPEDFSFA